MQSALQCFDACTGRDTVVTGGRGNRSRPNSSHARGEACDVGRNANPDLSRDNAEKCTLQCFPNGYGQEEGQHYSSFMKKIPIILFQLSVIAFLTSCTKQSDLVEKNEFAMYPDMAINAVNANGQIKIEATSQLERIFTWEGHNVKVRMRPRDKRWYGSLGIYSPGGSDDQIHVVSEEGQQHFFSEKEALEWLSWQTERMDYVYTSDGLIVGWNKTQNSISIQVWQFYISGKRPFNLPGARNYEITIRNKDKSSSQAIKVGKFQPSAPKWINGREYSGKSIDIMNERGITPDQIEKVIKEGESRQEANYVSFLKINDNYEPLWVKLDTQDRVVLVGN
jgi:hypothetical protein